MQDYARQIHPLVPRHWDLREWKQRGVLMLPPQTMDTFCKSRVLNWHFQGLKILLVGKDAEDMYAAWDPEWHDIRACEPYFFKDDPVNWRII